MLDGVWVMFSPHNVYFLSPSWFSRYLQDHFNFQSESLWDSHPTVLPHHHTLTHTMHTKLSLKHTPHSCLVSKSFKIEGFYGKPTGFFWWFIWGRHQQCFSVRKNSTWNTFLEQHIIVQCTLEEFLFVSFKAYKGMVLSNNKNGISCCCCCFVPLGIPQGVDTPPFYLQDCVIIVSNQKVFHKVEFFFFFWKNA